MTRHSVIWDDEAVSSLAFIWLEATNREQIRHAVDSIDTQLAADPIGNSKPLSEGLRAIDVPPIRAVFSVDADGRIVDLVRLRLL